jgi:hypothetical protein
MWVTLVWIIVGIMLRLDQQLLNNYVFTFLNSLFRLLFPCGLPPKNGGQSLIEWREND